MRGGDADTGGNGHLGGGGGGVKSSKRIEKFITKCFDTCHSHNQPVGEAGGLGGGPRGGGGGGGEGGGERGVGGGRGRGGAGGQRGAEVGRRSGATVWTTVLRAETNFVKFSPGLGVALGEKLGRFKGGTPEHLSRRQGTARDRPMTVHVQPGLYAKHLPPRRRQW